jgi:TetR/AcrR family transcriptional repressor of nem operon
MSAVEKKRDRIIEVGVDLFLNRGYTDSGIKDVAEAAGIPKGSFHYYFDSKEALGIAAVGRFSEVNTALRGRYLLADRDIPPLQRLRTYYTEYAREHGEAGSAGGCLLGNMSAEVADHSAPLRSTLQAGFASWQDMVCEVLDEAVARKDLPPDFATRQIAEFLVNGWEGALIRMKAEKSVEPLHNFIETIFGHVLKANRR